MSQYNIVGNVKIGLTMSSIQGLYMYGIAVQIASQAWRGMGGQGNGVRGVLNSIPGRGNPPLLMLSVSNEIGEEGKIVKKCWG